MSAFQAALDELDDRVKAIAAQEPTAEQTVATITGQPDDLIRMLLSGYVPIEETDEVLQFLTLASRGIQHLVFTSNNPVAVHAGLRFTIAQMVVAGVALGRGEG